MTVYGLVNDGQAQINALKLRQLILPLLNWRDTSDPLSVDGGVRMNATDPNAMQVTAGSAGLTCDVAPGMCVVPGTTTPGQGGYPLIVDATETVTLDPADGGQSRYDRIIAKVTDTGDENSVYEITKVTGTPAGTPTIPALPADSLKLASVLVPAGATLPGQLTITDERIQIGVVGRHQGANIPFGPPAALVPQQTTTSSTFTSVTLGRWFVSHPTLELLIMYRSSAADTTGELRVTINGTQFGTTRIISGNAWAYATFPAAAHGVPLGTMSTLLVEVRRTAGAGNVGARVDGAHGFFVS